MKEFPRRDFLVRSAAGALIANAAPALLSAQSTQSARRAAPSDRVVVGLIGCGDLGTKHHLARKLLPNPRVEMGAVCDVDHNHADAAAEMILKAKNKRVPVFYDFRRLLERREIDAVLTPVPDHWHALISIAAMEAGKDVYCEKPLTLTIEEGKHMVATARRYGTVFQTGSQQRSDARFRLACELARNQKFGKLQKVTTHIGAAPKGKWEPFQTPPANLDWNFWLGPAPWADYAPNRCHYEFRWHYDYSGGKMTDWGAHHNDIAQWGIGADGSGPVRVEGKGEFNETGPYDTAIDFVVNYRYQNGVELVCQSAGENGVKFYGADGWVFVSRSRIEASDPEILKTQFGPNDIRLYVSKDHHENWLDCIQSRQRPICDVEIGHRSVTVCHMGNLSMRLGRALNWDPDREVFAGDDEANSMATKPKRAPWRL